MDIKLPDMNGLDITRQLKSKKPDIPIIAQTAYTMDHDRKKCFDAGCSSYFTKPMDIKTLLSLIDRYIKNTQNRKQET
jgi:CheY-like chemotaxis protein